MRAVTLKRNADNLVSFVCPADVDPDKARRAVADVRPYYCVPSEILPLVSLPERRRTAARSTSRCCYGWPRSSRRWPDRDLTEPGDRRAATARLRTQTARQAPAVDALQAAGQADPAHQRSVRSAKLASVDAIPRPRVPCRPRPRRTHPPAVRHQRPVPAGHFGGRFLTLAAQAYADTREAALKTKRDHLVTALGVGRCTASRTRGRLSAPTGLPAASTLPIACSTASVTVGAFGFPGWPAR